MRKMIKGPNNCRKSHQTMYEAIHRTFMPVIYYISNSNSNLNSEFYSAHTSICFVDYIYIQKFFYHIKCFANSIFLKNDDIKFLREKIQRLRYIKRTLPKKMKKSHLIQ
jgi:hypothetical protein